MTRREGHHPTTIRIPEYRTRVPVSEGEPPLTKAHDVSGSGDRYEALLEVLEHQTTQAAEDRAREIQERRRAPVGSQRAIEAD
ncbi:MAG: hypothetical protein ACOC3J_01580, partial [Gemmatimonadota bacterium]